MRKYEALPLRVAAVSAVEAYEAQGFSTTASVCLCACRMKVSATSIWRWRKDAAGLASAETKARIETLDYEGLTHAR